MPHVHFVTGFPGFIGKSLVRRLLEVDKRARAVLLSQPRYAPDAKAHLAELPAEAQKRVELLTGDVTDMHLGLSGDEYRQVTHEVTHIFHLAAIRHLGVDRRTIERVNVDGTRNVLELGRDCKKLERLAHMSTVHVAGDRQGVIDEDELEEGQRFRNAYEETKYRAEVLVRRAMPGLPISVFRPATVVGDSSGGKIDRFDGPYYLAFRVVTSPLRVPLPLPGNGSFPLHIVPRNWVASAIAQLALDPRGVGRTFHLVDPNPMSARKVYETIARKAGKPMPRLGLPGRATATLLKIPLLDKFARPERAAVEQLDQIAFYNWRNALELLDGTGLQCPPLSTYLDQLVEQVEQHARERVAQRQRRVETEDPLAPAPEGAAPADEEGLDAPAPVEPKPAVVQPAPKPARKRASRRQSGTSS